MKKQSIEISTENRLLLELHNLRQQVNLADQIISNQDKIIINYERMIELLKTKAKK